MIWALIGLPLGCGAILATAGGRANRVAAPVAVVVALAVLMLAGAAAAAHPNADVAFVEGIRLGFAVDGLSAVLAVTVTAVTMAVLVFAAGDIGSSEARSRFFGLMLIFAGAMLVTVTAATLAALLMGWEVMGAVSWALIGFWWRDRARVEAATTAFVTTRAGDVGLYVAAGAALAGGVGSLRLDGLPHVASPWLGLVTAGVIAAAFGKSAQLPFSFWLSRAMQGPSPVSALLHSATMVAAGAYLLLRLEPLLAASGWGLTLVAWTGASTALLLGLVAVGQSDLKQLLAASTCAQIGLMMLAAGAGGTAAGTAQLVAHAATKSLLFLAAGAWLSALGTKQLAALAGAGRRYRLVGATFTAGALTLAGIPPLSLWATKDGVLAAALARSPSLYAAGLAAAVISAVYSIRAARQVWLPAPARGEAAYDAEGVGTRRVGPLMVVPLLALAVVAAGLGVFALPDLAAAFGGAIGAAGEPAPGGWMLVLSGGLAAIAAALTWRFAGRLQAPGMVRSALVDWLGLERAAHLLVVRPTLRAARALAHFDDVVLDGGVSRVGAAALAGARAATRIDDGVDEVVSGIGAGARRLGSLARRPQTGLLHQYYIQAAVALAALVAILVVVR